MNSTAPNLSPVGGIVDGLDGRGDLCPEALRGVRGAAWLHAFLEDSGPGTELGPVWLDDLVAPTVQEWVAAADAFGADTLEDQPPTHGAGGQGTGASAASAWADPGPVPESLAAWVRPQWWAAPIRAQVRALMVMAPGAQLATALADLGRQQTCPADHRHHDPNLEAADPTPAPGSAPGWPCACQLVTAAAWAALAGWAEVGTAAAIVDVGGPETLTATPPVAIGRVADPARAELAAALRLTCSGATGRLYAARDLHAHPDLAALAADASLLPAAWRAILGETSNLPEPARSEVIDHVVARIRDRMRTGRRPWTPTETRRAAKLAVLRLAPDIVADARTAAKARRRVVTCPDADGMAWLHAYLPDTDAARIHHRLTAAATAHKADHPDDPRTADERRADLLTQALLGHPSTPNSTHPGQPVDTGNGPDQPTDTGGEGQPAAGGLGPVPVTARSDIAVVIDAATLLRAVDNPALIPGIGAVPADVGRELAADGRWRAWITDPHTGVVTATSTHTYTPSAALARLIRAREPRCRMPGCTRSATTSDLDHTTPYPHGPTTPANLGPLCRTHHNLKTHHGYQLTNHPPPDNSPPNDHNPPTGWTWTHPSGLTHTDQPDPPLPDP